MGVFLLDTRTMEYIKKYKMNSISPNLNLMIKAVKKLQVIIETLGRKTYKFQKGPKRFVTKTDKRVEKIIEELSKTRKTTLL